MTNSKDFQKKEEVLPFLEENKEDSDNFLNADKFRESVDMLKIGDKSGREIELVEDDTLMNGMD